MGQASVVERAAARQGSNNYCWLTAFYVLGLSSPVSHSILGVLEGKHYQPHFTAEETEAQGS